MRPGDAITCMATAAVSLVLGVASPVVQASNPVPLQSGPQASITESERLLEAALPVRSLHHIELIEALRARLPPQGASPAADASTDPDAAVQDVPLLAEAQSACT